MSDFGPRWNANEALEFNCDWDILIRIGFALNDRAHDTKSASVGLTDPRGPEYEDRQSRNWSAQEFDAYAGFRLISGDCYSASVTRLCVFRFLRGQEAGHEGKFRQCSN